MRASPYIKALESQAAAWEVLMVTLQEIVDNWLTCQVGARGEMQASAVLIKSFP